MRESTTLPLCRAAHGHSLMPVERVLQQAPQQPDPERSEEARPETKEVWIMPVGRLFFSEGCYKEESGEKEPLRELLQEDMERFYFSSFYARGLYGSV